MPSFFAAASADEPSGPSVTTWTTSGRRARHMRSNARFDGSPIRSSL
jgi:hypothetical protein